jgi:cyclophilin family peptidyl-prolyl cis-trans isomerase/HEAT repeat protein
VGGAQRDGGDLMFVCVALLVALGAAAASDPAPGDQRGPEAAEGLEAEGAAQESAPAPAPAAERSMAQRVRELEWSRADLLLLASQIPGSEPRIRADVAVALGRLRTEGAVDLLVGLRDDPDRGVRVAAAQALAWTPGSASAIRDWLASERLPTSPAGRSSEADGVAVALIDGLGQATEGDPADVALLRERLGDPWPFGAAAARAIGRAGQRKVEGIGPAVHALVDRLDATDPRVAAAAAWALSRAGLDEASEEELARIERRIRSGSYETTRAWLVKAAWPLLAGDVRDELFIDGATDPSRLVRIAVLGALRPGDVEPDVIATWLADPDPWIRLAAIDALGRVASEDAESYLVSHVDRASDPYEQAAAIRWLRAPDPQAARDPSLDPVVRAAHVARLEDAEALVAFATDAEVEPVVRTAAAAALLKDTEVPAAIGERLLATSDPAVREAGLELVARLPPADQVRVLELHLRVETDPDVLASGLEALAAALVEAPPAARTPASEALVARAAIRSEPRVRAGAAEVAAALGIEAPQRAASEVQGERELVLPGGEVARIERGRPAVAAAARIRGARIDTSEGTFLLALDPDVAPYAVANFARLAEAGWFDGQVFHRVIPGFVVQTGCPRGDGWGGPGYAIPDEVSALPYDAGALGMARADRDTGGSQWFVTTAPQPHLVGEYTRFGEVVGGMHVVKRLRPGSRLLEVTIERLPGG